LSDKIILSDRLLGQAETDLDDLFWIKEMTATLPPSIPPTGGELEGGEIAANPQT
jgi:hypothetical protein